MEEFGMNARSMEKDRSDLLVVLEEGDMDCRPYSRRMKEGLVAPLNGSLADCMRDLGAEKSKLVIVVVKDLTIKLVSRLEVVAKSLGEDYKALVIFPEDDARLDRFGRMLIEGHIMTFTQLMDFVSTIRLLLERESVFVN
jgi:hypothetical protein